MSGLGQVRIGGKAPFFQCEAVISGVIAEVSLSTYIKPSTKPATPDPQKPWLIILFIPAAFSFVCPTEVLAFQNCYEEFKDRNCGVVFVSVDTKHSLWHWTNVPRQYGGLGQIDIPLLSDATHRMAKDYGVLIEDQGVSLRGMFIIDGEGIVQQITLNNLTVGRSVLEALRLLEAFQAVAKHGVLCPIDWKPSSGAADTINTISNTLAESYDERLANLQREFENVPVTDLDAAPKKDGSGQVSTNNSRRPSDEIGSEITSRSSNSATPKSSARSDSGLAIPPLVVQEVVCERPAKPVATASQELLRVASRKSASSFTPSNSLHPARPSSAPSSSSPTPSATPSTASPPFLRKVPGSVGSTARHSRGRRSVSNSNVDQQYVTQLFSSPASSTPSIFQALARRISSPTEIQPGHSTAPPIPLVRSKSPALTPGLRRHNTYESRQGKQVVLEFADPTLAPQISPGAHTPPTLGFSPPSPSRKIRSQSVSRTSSPQSGRAMSWTGAVNPGASANPNGSSTSQTRLQATFEAIKKMSAGLASPRIMPGTKNLGADYTPGEGRSPGYFDDVLEGVEA